MIAMLGRDADPATARVVIGPNTLYRNGTTTIDWFVPSLDATRVAVSLSEGGSEDGSLHIFDVATGQEMGEVISRVHVLPGRLTAKASITRAPNGRPRSATFSNAFISTNSAPLPSKITWSLAAIFPGSLRSRSVRIIAWSWLQWRMALAASLPII